MHAIMEYLLIGRGLIITLILFFISINYYFVLNFLEYLNLGAINLCACFYIDTTHLFILSTGSEEHCG